MARSRKSAVKVLLLIWLVFTPYYIWLLVSLLKNALPPWPWPGLVCLGYLAIGIPVAMVLARKISSS
jgi:hypothetical protein